MSVQISWEAVGEAGHVGILGMSIAPRIAAGLETGGDLGKGGKGWNQDPGEALLTHPQLDSNL